MLYLFKTEGEKEFKESLESCFKVKQVDDVDQNETAQLDNSMIDAVPRDNVGAVEMNHEIFNVIQLLEICRLCTEGKAELAELKARMSILSFAEACNILIIA